jgi:hypothetical protein
MGLDDTSTVSYWFSIYLTIITAKVTIMMLFALNCLFLDMVCKARYVLPGTKNP